MKSLVIKGDSKVWIVYTTSKINVYDITTIDPNANCIEDMVVEEKSIPKRVIDSFVKSKNELTWERQRDWVYALETSNDVNVTSNHIRNYEWGANLINMLLTSRDALKGNEGYYEANESFKAQIANYIMSYKFIDALKHVDGNEFT